MRGDGELAPVRAAIRAAADREVQEIEAAALDEASELEAEAEREAAELLADARRDGARAGAQTAALRAARARRSAHRAVLVERERWRAALLEEVVRRAGELRADPRYPGLRARLEAECRARLGPEAVVVEAPAGGVVAEVGSRRLDLSLVVLAEQAALEVRQEAGEAR